MYSYYPCFLIPFLNSVAIPISIISSMGNTIVYLKQCYNGAHLLNKHYNEDKYNNYNRGFLYKACNGFTEQKYVKLLLTYITISYFYVNFISNFNINYSMHPFTAGFCISE
ncbi:hypothetical protein PIROE2DRAFT_3668 [Piromyces sp. E2]|nr:hypothetical protein PIROE2DRAFT_3668 [Piromyces sp. E2]|eukprot:OUM68537.1 hypothetical protein PIROE2DRAFT_3668 [Piromyces sp. E2]